MWPPPSSGGSASSAASRGRAARRRRSARRPCGPSRRRSPRRSARRRPGSAARPASRRRRRARRLARARAAMSATGLIVPSDVGDVDAGDDLDAARGEEPSSASRSRRPSASTGDPQRARRPSSATGTMLEWCSISVRTTLSPGPTVPRATRFIASVALRVKTVVRALRRRRSAAIAVAGALEEVRRLGGDRVDAAVHGRAVVRRSSRPSRRGRGAASARWPPSRGRRGPRGPASGNSQRRSCG